MSKEFFVAEWLRHRHVLYLVSHMAIIPLVDFYATACDWWPAGEGPPEGLGWFVAVSYFNGVVIEIGRKVRGPSDEEVGVNTYSALWGPRTAVLVWLAAMTATAGLAVVAAVQIDFIVPVALVLGILLLAAGWTARQFLADPVTRRSKRIETVSGVWTLGLYLILGAVPLLWRAWSLSGKG
jgi:4-hydroxybenzoate polyprenyltransferase